ncbi:hypothetical protein NDU88_000638 [Pleurodeles waltl]|uniref:Uncharacterized protein n=1 Tax=Pleurodeles waltl TaxID=8319 RepID=A0AAV7WIP5_PLEWA|nr:hypothetical protein NDU88_000638 [Pleurodeles waltl]
MFPLFLQSQSSAVTKRGYFGEGPASTQYTGGTPVEVREVPEPDQGVMSILTDIRQALSTLTTPSATQGVKTTEQPVLTPAFQAQGSVSLPMPSTAQASTQDATAQALLSVVQLLSSLDTPSASVPPTASWPPTDTDKNTLEKLKRQISAIAAARINGPSAADTVASGDTPLLGVQSPPSISVDKGKVIDNTTIKSGGVGLLTSTGQNTLLSRPGKFVSHVSTKVKEIGKGSLLTLFTHQG